MTSDVTPVHTTRPIQFGLGVPTGTEGMMYPVPYAGPAEAVRLAVAAEELGFDSVWGNDHVSTQRYVREEFADPPRFYDPLSFLSFVAARTTRISLATAILVMPFRHPVVAAKQLATLDQLSGGRAICGVGIGAYREEFEAMWPGRQLHRGRFAVEYIDALRVLFQERRASYRGEFIEFDDVESFPKPTQQRFPILSGGNAEGVRRRAALQCDGWIPACLSPDEIASGLDEIRERAASAGRSLDGFDVAPQLAVSLGSTREAALEWFNRSQLAAHMRSLSKTTLKDQQDGDVVSRNLIGTADEVVGQVRRYAAAGVTTLSALLFACNTVAETLDAMHEFAETVIAPVRSADRSEGAA
ncbi:MAG: TIGR03619 family F420-dependent LLM class oxidoreductase [Acidimicrobiales bacterium]